MTARRGIQTSEFWLALAGMVAGTALILTGHEESGALLLSAACGAYAVSRGIVKRSAD